MRFLLHVVDDGFVLKKEGEMWQAKFATLRDALQHAESYPGSDGAKVTVVSESGRKNMEIEL